MQCYVPRDGRPLRLVHTCQAGPCHLLPCLHPLTCWHVRRIAIPERVPSSNPNPNPNPNPNWHPRARIRSSSLPTGCCQAPLLPETTRSSALACGMPRPPTQRIAPRSRCVLAGCGGIRWGGGLHRCGALSVLPGPGLHSGFETPEQIYGHLWPPRVPRRERPVRLALRGRTLSCSCHG